MLTMMGRTAAPWVFWIAVATILYVYAGYGLILWVVSAIVHRNQRGRLLTCSPQVWATIMKGR